MHLRRKDALFGNNINTSHHLHVTHKSNDLIPSIPLRFCNAWQLMLVTLRRQANSHNNGWVRMPTVPGALHLQKSLTDYQS